jgi:hypothetical protein
MSNLPFNVDPEKLRVRRLPAWLVRSILILSGLLFIGFGIFMVMRVLSITNAGNHKMAILFIVLVVVICAVPIAQVFFVLKKLRKSSSAEGSQSRGEAPWLARADWAAGRIKSSSVADVRLWLIVGLGFCCVGAFLAVFVLPQELHESNYRPLFALIFPAVGIYLIVYALRPLRSQWRYGECFFQMTSVPGALGGTLEGWIETGARFRPRQGLQLRLACVRRTVHGAGDDQRANETVLWRDEQIFKNETDFPEPEPGHARIPVNFKLPADQPECFARGNESVSWRLEVKARMAGPNFKAKFDVPVFRVAAPNSQVENEQRA